LNRNCVTKHGIAPVDEAPYVDPSGLASCSPQPDPAERQGYGGPAGPDRPAAEWWHAPDGRRFCEGLLFGEQPSREMPIACRRRCNCRESRASVIAGTNQSIADFGNRLDREAPRIQRQERAPQPRQGSIDGVFADDAPSPTCFDQIIASQDAPICPREGDEHLHDARFERLASPLPFELPIRWVNIQPAHVERRFVR
jgi:hypothetical protein